MILQQYKIVFAGSMGAGKTEAIRSLSDIPVLSTEALNTEPYRVCRRVNILRDYPDDKIKIYP